LANLANEAIIGFRNSGKRFHRQTAKADNSFIRLSPWPAFWLAGVNGISGAPNSGGDVAEIDIMEAYSVDYTKYHRHDRSQHWHIIIMGHIVHDLGLAASGLAESATRVSHVVGKTDTI